MKLITIEDIDQIAEGLKDALCNSTVPEKREAFELAAYNYLKEALDPWRDETNPETTKKFFIDGQEIKADSWERAAQKVLDWNGLHVETKEICNDCGVEYVEGHNCKENKNK